MIIATSYAPECIEWFQRRAAARRTQAARDVLVRAALTAPPELQGAIVNELIRLDADG